MAQIAVIGNRTKVMNGYIFLEMHVLCMYDQSSKSVVKLKVTSFKGTNSGHQRIFQLQNPHVLFYPSETLSPGFLISPIKPYIIGPHNSPILFFLLILFPMPILFSSFYITTLFSTSTSALPAFYHSHY